jgi:hypothetical protein
MTTVLKIKSTVLVSFAFLIIAAIAFSSSATMPSEASSGGPPTGRTGAPGEANCTACHSATGQTGQFNIIAPTNYVPGQTYVIEVRNVTTDLSRNIWGFELIPLTAANAMAGTVGNININTRIRVSGTKSYVEQSAAGAFAGTTGGSTWNFNWTAPATDIGPVTMYAAGLHGDGAGDTDGDQTYTRSVVIQPAVAAVVHHGFSDFDGDGKADVSVFRPSDQNWYLSQSTAGFGALKWGLASDRLAPADYDGDDKTDVAVWRSGPAGEAAFYILKSTNNTVRIEPFGQAGDDPTAVGDWDGDGSADPAVYRAAAFGPQSYFYFRGSLNNPVGNVTYLPWGTAGDVAMRGDFDGDGKFDAAVFRPSTAVWYILQSSNATLRADNWGLATDKFVSADYDGDGKVDLAVFRDGTWYVKQSSNGQFAYYTWGSVGDLPTPADYDGDGKTDAAVYRGGTWYVRISNSGAMSVRNFGLGTDVPIANAYVK